MSFICGTFNNQEEDDFEALCPYSPPPSRKARSHKFCSRRKKANNKNPYSSRGLDKFEALLADIDDKKRKIFTQKDPKRKDKDHHPKQNNLKDTNDHTSIPTLQDSTLDHMTEDKETQHAEPSIDTKIIRVDQWKLNLKRKFEELWMPSYNLPLFVILVLIFLTLFGRSLAIICTSIAWYLIPTIDGTIENTNRKPKKMIEHNHSRKPSENKMISSPKTFFSGPLNADQQNHKMKQLMSF
ncbi:uncharacterized protein [Rutidosis leptorrhynchoides]|uniref:uncharacterized protein n=1 Tax=Rutidosis leptorrhynchoides TaxID=125765 RepID=UPI003A992481